MNKDYWVYLLECNNNSYYTGYTSDLEKRVQAHIDAKAAKYTRSFKPTFIVCAWKIIQGKPKAMQIERWIKKLSRLQKQELISQSKLFESEFEMIRISRATLHNLNMKFFKNLQK